MLAGMDPFVPYLARWNLHPDKAPFACYLTGLNRFGLLTPCCTSGRRGSGSGRGRERDGAAR